MAQHVARIRRSQLVSRIRLVRGGDDAREASGAVNVRTAQRCATGTSWCPLRALRAQLLARAARLLVR